MTEELSELGSDNKEKKLFSQGRACKESRSHCMWDWKWCSSVGDCEARTSLWRCTYLFHDWDHSQAYKSYRLWKSWMTLTQSDKISKAKRRENTPLWSMLTWGDEGLVHQLKRYILSCSTQPGSRSTKKNFLEKLSESIPKIQQGSIKVDRHTGLYVHSALLVPAMFTQS